MSAGASVLRAVSQLYHICVRDVTNFWALV